MSGHSRVSTLVVAIAVALLASRCTASAPPTAAIDASYMPGSTDDDRMVLQQVVDSIAFKP